MPSSRLTPAQIDRILGIDWSGRIDAAGQRRHIWAGCWTRHPGGRTTVTLTSGRTREETAEWLIQLARETPRMVVGFDFCFSFPAWFVRGELGAPDAPTFWQLIAQHGHAERWLTQSHLDPRFWGRPHKRPAEFSGDHLHRMLRATDIDCKLVAHIPEAERRARVQGITPKSVFQIGGSGSVGTASLRGFATLLRLRSAGFRIWPFDAPALTRKRPAPLVVEMYTRLNTGAVHKSNPAARAAYLLRKRREDPAYAALSRTVLARARAGEDAFDALVSTMVMAAHHTAFATLPQPRDPLHSIEGWTWSPSI
jgi:hypothetical protein